MLVYTIHRNKRKIDTKLLLRLDRQHEFGTPRSMPLSLSATVWYSMVYCIYRLKKGEEVARKDTRGCKKGHLRGFYTRLQVHFVIQWTFPAAICETASAFAFSSCVIHSIQFVEKGEQKFKYDTKLSVNLRLSPEKALKRRFKTR